MQAYGLHFYFVTNVNAAIKILLCIAFAYPLRRSKVTHSRWNNSTGQFFKIITVRAGSFAWCDTKILSFERGLFA